MAKNQIDGLTRPGESSGGLMLEAKSTSLPARRSIPHHWIHGLLVVVLVVSAVKVPQFLVTFVMLSVCIVLSLIGFVFLVQLPVRYFASRLRNPHNSAAAAARAKLSEYSDGD